MRRIFIAVLCALSAFASAASAEPVGEAQFRTLESQVQQLTQTVRQLTVTLEEQSRELSTLRAAREVRPEAAAVPPVQYIPPRTLQGRWNPDIGVVADTVLKLDSPREDAEGADRVSVRELELVLGSPVDPYSRLDVTLSFSDFEETSLEEAYYTRYDLPGGFTGRLGRFKPYIGKALPVHRDSLDTVDEPLVIQRYFGLEGYNKSGADLKRPLDLPWDASHEIAIGILEGANGEDGSLFGQTRRHPTAYFHLKNYADLNDTTGLEFGISHLAGSRDDDSTFEVNVTGLDGTFIHRYADRRRLKLQAEAFHVNRTESFVETQGANGEVFFDDVDQARGLWGGYALFDWWFDPRWAAGFRYDNVQLIEDAAANPENADIGYTGYLTFHQSEFARWRLQFAHLDLADGNDDDQAMLQGTFAIGEHKHKLT